MAKNMQTKKRKASAAEADIEKPTKVKPVEKSDATLKKRKATEDAAPVKAKKAKTPAEPKPSKKTKASDEPKDDAIVPAEPTKASAASKKVNGVEKVKETASDSLAAKVPKEKKAAKSKTTKKSAPEPVEPTEEVKEDDEIMLDGDEDDAEMEEDDQTIALIQGFESDDEDVEMEGTFKKGQEIPQLPTEALVMSKKQQKKVRRMAEAGEKEESGVVYIGRIPHGFYENEMKEYFKQFGTIKNLRVSRNKKTGASKHYAFVEFESETVAEIVAKTMDSYLMFGHILKVKLVPAAQVHADLFKGANKRFKKVPWNKIAGRKLNQGASEEVWDQRIDREEQRRVKNADKLKAIGYEIDLPKVKTTREIVKKEKAPSPVAEEAQVSEPAPIEAAPLVEESKLAKKGKKTKAAATEAKPTVVDEPAKVEEVEAAPAVEASEKPKKGKKAKAEKAIVEEVKPEVTEASADSEVVEAPKAKKGKKAKVVKEVVEVVEVVEEVLPAIIEAPVKSNNKKRKAETTLAEPVAEAPERKIKKKTKATLVVESEDVVPEASTEKVRKTKKSKK